jgi:hypothetical protein
VTLTGSSAPVFSSTPSTRWPSSETLGSRRSSQPGSHHADAPAEEALELVDRALRFISAGVAALHD